MTYDIHFCAVVACRMSSYCDVTLESVETSRELLSERNPFRFVERESDEPDFDGLDADRAQHELSADDIANTGIDDLSFVGECGDWTRTRAECADVPILEFRRYRFGRRWRRRNRLDALLTRGANPVPIDVRLVGIGYARTVVLKIGNPIFVLVRRRWWR